jgi:hypothetical protein
MAAPATPSTIRAGLLCSLHDQLKHSLDDGIVPLGNGGVRGVLFKVTLLGYGYTFVSKGTGESLHS